MVLLPNLECRSEEGAVEAQVRQRSDQRIRFQKQKERINKPKKKKKEKKR